MLVEVPYTIWAGTFADLIKRSPGASFDSHDNHYTHLESRGKHDKVLCIGIFCKDGYYCSDAGRLLWVHLILRYNAHLLTIF